MFDNYQIKFTIIAIICYNEFEKIFKKDNKMVNNKMVESNQVEEGTATTIVDEEKFTEATVHFMEFNIISSTETDRFILTIERI